MLDADRIDTLFERTATQQYTRALLFSSVVQLMREVVLGVQPSVHAAYQAHKEDIGLSTTALYNKLDRVETAVAAALVRDSARLAAPVVQTLRAPSAVGAWLCHQGTRRESCALNGASSPGVARHLGRPTFLG